MPDKTPRTFTFGHYFCPQCGVDVDPEEEGKDQYCEACEDMFKSYAQYCEDEKAVLDAMAEWEAERYGY